MMKKLWKAGVACAAMLLMLSGCSNSSQSEQEATTEAASDEIVVDYSKGLTKNGKLKGVTPADLVTVCDYANIQIPKDEVEPSKDDVTAQAEAVLKNYGVYEGKAKKGQTVNIDYKGTIDGEEFSGGTATGQSLEIGSKTFIDDFEDQIIGHEPGDTFDVEVTFPEDYSSEEVAGKDAVFSVTLNYIVPELTDDFVEKNFSETDGISTVKEFRKAVKDNLRLSNENTYVWNYMVTNSTFEEIPDDVMDARLEVSLDTLRKQYHDYMGYDDDQILEMYGYDSMDDVKEELKNDTETNIKDYLIAEVIADEQNLEVDDAAVETYLGEDNVDSYYEVYGKAYVKAQTRISVVSDYLIEHATLK